MAVMWVDRPHGSPVRIRLPSAGPNEWLTKLDGRINPSERMFLDKTFVLLYYGGHFKNPDLNRHLTAEYS